MNEKQSAILRDMAINNTTVTQAEAECRAVFFEMFKRLPDMNLSIDEITKPYYQLTAKLSSAGDQEAADVLLKERSKYIELVEGILAPNLKQRGFGSLINANRLLSWISEIDPAPEASVAALKSLTEVQTSIMTGSLPGAQINEKGELVLPDIKKLGWYARSAPGRTGQELEQVFTKLDDSDVEIYTWISTKLSEYVPDTCRWMWLCALDDGFSNEKYKQARQFFEQYTIRFIEDDEGEIHEVRHVQELLADLYVDIVHNNKNSNEAWLDRSELENWSTAMYFMKQPEAVLGLAAGLKWAGEESSERHVLLTCLKEMKEQMPSVFRKRLDYLLLSEQVSITVYEKIPQGVFACDTAAIKWQPDKELRFFLEEWKNKGNPDYSLLYTQREKRIRLKPGQLPDHETWTKRMTSVSDEYGGEIIASSAPLFDLAEGKIITDNGILFTLKTPRCPCGCLYTYYEMYGRMMRVLELICYKPKADMTAEESEKLYPMLKDNIYMDTFAEALEMELQDWINEMPETAEGE